MSSYESNPHRSEKRLLKALLEFKILRTAIHLSYMAYNFLISAFPPAR